MITYCHIMEIMPRKSNHRLVEQILKLHNDDVYFQCEILILHLFPDKQAESILKAWSGEKMSKNQRANFKIGKNKVQTWVRFIELIKTNDELEDLRKKLMED